MSIKNKIARARRKVLGLEEINEKLVEIKYLIQGNSESLNSFWSLKNIDGMKYLLDRRSMVDKEILKSNEWEQESWNLLMESLNCFNKDQAIEFLDVGAYFGLFAIKAKKSSRFSKIACFEWDETNFTQLKANLLINGILEDIQCHKVFLGQSGKNSRIESSKEFASNRGMSGSLGAAKNSISVKNTSLDSIWKSKNVQIVVKMDVEGNEADVLKGAKQLIKMNQILLLVEHQNFSEKETKFMRTLGFDLVNQIPKDKNYLYKNF